MIICYSSPDDIFIYLFQIIIILYIQWQFEYSPPHSEIQTAISKSKRKYMKYEFLNKSSFIKINNLQISKYKKFEYSIEKLSLGKRAQSKYIRRIISSLINYKPKNKNNIFYNNINSSEIYSKEWWLI